MGHQALVLDMIEGKLTSSITEVDTRFEKDRGDVFLKVIYSSVNYKDGLAVTGKGKIVRSPYPFIPGIDLVGEVVESSSDHYQYGDLVVCTGWQLGEANPGGYSQYQTVRSDWLVPLPDTLTPEESMVVGTAGFTAALAVLALIEHGANPEDGEVVVTGATGGVGSFSVALLHANGFDVVASTGKSEEEYLTALGASRIIHRSELSDGPFRPLDSARWAGAVDSVGGTTLATLLSQMQLHASVSACGLAASHDLNTNVFPFILRGVNLLGIDSNYCPYDRRVRAWNMIGDTLKKELYDQMKEVVSLEQVPDIAEMITQGLVRGRIVVKLH